MTELEKLAATEELRQLKARYFRGVDLDQPALIRELLADDCELDYRGCCTDPESGRDFLPAMNMVLRGQAAKDAFGKARMRSAHHGHNFEVTFTSDTSADVLWAMSDRLWLPEGAPIRELRGWGHYHETYVKVGGAWKLKTLRITRVRVEGA